MTDPVTPAKNLLLPTVGSDNNVWGTFLNDNFAQIDAALGGTLSLAIVGNISLSTTQALNTAYIFTGTLNAIATIQFPPFFGFAVISNKTTGNFGLTITYGSGISVTINALETTVLWADGTNFYRMSSGALSLPLSLAQGGTGTSLATTGGSGQVLKQLSSGAVITVGKLAALDLSNGTTGTGAVVLAASPTTTGTLTTAAIIASGNINTTGQFQISGTPINAGNLSNGTTGTGAVVLATGAFMASPTLNNPTFTGSVTNNALGNFSVTGNISAGGQFQVNGVQISAANLSNGTSGTGAILLASSPTITSPTISSPTFTGTVTQAGNFSATGTINAGVQYQVAGVQIAASNLSNGTSGSGAILLASSPTINSPVFTGASTSSLVVNGNINTGGQFQVSGVQIAASNLLNGVTGSGTIVLSTSPSLSDGTRIGTAAGSVSAPTTSNTNLLLYNNSSTNWSGIGSDVSGNFYVTTGVSGVSTRLSVSNLGAVRLWNYGLGALQSDASGNITSGQLPVSMGGTGVNTSTGTGNTVLSISPLLTGLVGIGNTGASNWRMTIQGLGTTSATFPLVVENSIGTGCFYVRDDTTVFLPQYGNGALSVSGGAIVSGTLGIASGGTGTTAATGSGSLVLQASPLLTGNVGIGGTGLSNWRTTIQGLGTTSATFSLVIDNSVGSGSFWVRDDGVAFLPQYVNGALSTSGGALVSGTLGIGSGGTGTTTNTGSGSLVLSTSPTFSGNIGFGQASASNWRSYFHGIGTTSATYSIVAQNANSSGLLYVRDDGTIAFPAYAAGFLQTDSGGNISPLGATGTGVVALNVNPNLSVVAAGSTAFATLAFRFGLALYPSDFGAVGNGSTDDSVALQNWLNAGANNHIELRMAARTYATTSGLGLGNPNGLTIRGAGANSSVILYIGSSTTSDILGIGSGTQTIGITLADFRIASNRTMTSSSGLHLFNVCRSHLDNIILDGQDGNGNLSTGFYFDQVDAVWLKGYEARAQIHGILVSGTVGVGPKAGLYITHGKIASCLYGLRCGGAFGGLQIDESDIIVNTYGILIDQGAKAEANREIFIGQNCSVDSSINDNIYVNDAGGGTLSMHNWNASAGQNGLNVVSWAGKIEIAGGPYFNNVGNGMVFQDSRSTVHISDGVQIHDNGGWGITSTVFTDIFYQGGLDNLGNGLGMVNISTVHLRHPCTQGTVTIVNGGGFELPQRSGIISVSSLHSGDTGVYVLGGGSAVLIGTSQGSFVNGFPGGGQNSVRWDGNAYQIVNESGVDVTFQWAMVSSRFAN